MWKKIIVCAVLVIGAGPGFAQDQGDVNVEFEGIYWFSELRANALINGETRRGREFNLENDLGLGERDIPSGRFTWFTGPKSRLILDYSQRDFHGQTVLNRQIEFRDTTFDVGASASTDLTVRLAKFGWVWQFINAGDGTFKLGTILEARAAFTDLSVTGQAVGVGATKAEETVNVGLPTLGFALDINPAEWANLFVRLAGMSFGRYGFLADGEAGIKLIPGRNLSISGGYRYQATEARSADTDSYLKFTFKGPFAAASLRF